MATGNTGLTSAPSERPRITAALVSLDAEAKATRGRKAARRWPETFIFANGRWPTGETETHIVVQTSKGGHVNTFFYAILRVIPSKVGGVLTMAGAIAILFKCPLSNKCVLRSVLQARRASPQP